jgi:23S rRNA pseudouridine1911/1915/1917 synthase
MLATDIKIADLILFDDKHIVALNKLATLPSQPDQTGDASLIELAEVHFGQKLHLIHRLDRPASGVMLLAKHTEAAAAFSHLFQAQRCTKIYWAIVSERPPAERGVLVHFLKKINSNKTISQNEAAEGFERAELSYVLRGVSDRYFLLEIQLQTGRFHQIRAQLAAIGCPIKGDVKYGARRANADRGISLHARQLEFKHPLKRKPIVIEAPTPDDALWKALSTVSNKE